MEPEPAIEARTPVAWGLLLIPALALLASHLVTGGNYGMFRDEYYYLACAARPDWGYVDHPSFSIWFLAGWTGIFGDSLASVRIPPALCGVALVVLTGVAAARFGAGRQGQLLAATAIAVGGNTLVVTGFYSMNAFDFVLWLAAYTVLVSIMRTGDGRNWPLFGLVVGVGLFNKIGLLVFGAALVGALLVTPHRRHFADRRLYIGGAIALAFLLPYGLWNAANDWAALEFIENAKSGKIASFTPLEYLQENALAVNPVTLPVWLGGLGWLLFARSARRFQLVGLMFVATFVLLVAQKSKPYYMAASFPILMAAGGAAWDRWTSRPRLRWARWGLLSVVVAGGLVLAPAVVPVLEPERTLSYMRALGIMPAPQEVSHRSELPQYYADRFGWENLARVVSEVYRELPEDERARCIALGQNYGHAGAIEYWSRAYELPQVYSTHNNYYLWGPPPSEADVVIVVRGDPAELRELFEDVVQVAVAETPGAIESSMTIWLCRYPRQSLRDLWPRYRSYG